MADGLSISADKEAAAARHRDQRLLEILVSVVECFETDGADG